MSEPTTLGYAILGLLQNPMSGYRVRKLFETTPMGHYSSGPGTIYPALKRLQEWGLIEQFEDKKSSAGKKLFRLTRKGKRKLIEWLSRPASFEEVEKNLPLLLLRFAFMENLVALEVKARFLESFKNGVDEQIKKLSQYRKQNRESMPLHGLLALDHGIQEYKASSRWAAYALKAIIREGESLDE